MSKRINCAECGIYLGEIRDATLRKRITYLCKDCNTNRLAMKMSEKIDSTQKQRRDDFIRDIFKSF